MKNTEAKKIIEVKNLSKTFNIRRGCESGFLSFIDNLFTLEKKVCKQAIRDIDFFVSKNEMLGIIGSNGSGKSTLLRTIAGIYKAQAGEIKLDGKVLYLSGFVQGFSKELSLRENVFNMGYLLGLRKKEIESEIIEIFKFAGLTGLEKDKLYTLSDGMNSRLSFSATIHLAIKKGIDILLLDETFSGGGDLDFKRKTLSKIEELISNNTTVILVTHQLGIVKKYCNRVLWLEDGMIKEIGNSDEIVQKYIDFTKQKQNKSRL